MLLAGYQHTRQDRMGLRSRLSAVTTIGFPGNHRRSDHAFRLVVGGIQAVHVQEPQQVRTVLPQPLGKAGIVRIGKVTSIGNQSIKASFQTLGSIGKGKRIQVWLLGFQPQGVLQQRGHLPHKLQRSTRFALPHVLQVSQQMTDTFLFQPIAQALFIIGQEAIRGQNPFELLAQNIDHYVARAVGANIVNRNLMIREHPEPGRQRSNSPARFICVNHTALADQLNQSFIYGSGCAGQFLIGPTPPTSANLQTKTIVQHFTHFAVRDTQAMLEVCRQGFRTRTHDDRPRNSGCFRDLIRVPRSALVSDNGRSSRYRSENA